MTLELSKARSDAWDAPLDEAQRWRVYAQFRRAQWFEVSAWINKEYGIAAPSRTALYRWAGRMRSLESAHRIEQAVTAREEVGALAAGAGHDDAALIEAYKAMAAEIAMRTGDAATAGKYVEMAMSLAAAQAKRQELELKARAQETRDEALKLARQKFDSAEARINAAKATIADATISLEAREKKLREIFGLK